ncbi:hypothetical protein V8G54_014155 [Vigna mungo]|uniref:Uncharacterized protein n=1 Tax=Vigna mungo TaxID=3915 RepID=A0AAQ3NIN2_VIGMU
MMPWMIVNWYFYSLGILPTFYSSHGLHTRHCTGLSCIDILSRTEHYTLQKQSLEFSLNPTLTLHSVKAYSQNYRSDSHTEILDKLHHPTPRSYIKPLHPRPLTLGKDCTQSRLLH